MADSSAGLVSSSNGCPPKLAIRKYSARTRNLQPVIRGTISTTTVSIESDFLSVPHFHLIRDCSFALQNSMEDPLIRSPPQTPDKKSTKERTRSFSQSPSKSPRTPRIADILPKSSPPPSEPIPIHITSERYSVSGDQSAPESLLTLISLNSPSKDFFTSVIKAATSAASTLTFTRPNQSGSPIVRTIYSGFNSVNSKERQNNLIPYFSRIKQPAMATSATDLSIAEPITAGSPTSTLEQLEQISNHSNSNQSQHSGLDDSSVDMEVTLSRSQSVPSRRNLGKTSILRRARPRSNTFTYKDDAHDSDGSNMTTAAKKKNIDFHHLFKDVPDSAVLIEDYTCAIAKEILVHGRMYVSEDLICFYANIFGFVTNVVIKFKDVVSIERRNTAFFVPNAILVSTLQQKYLFGSFLVREAAFNCLVYLWRKNHPALVENLAYCDSESNLESPYNVGPRPHSESNSESFDSDELSEEGSVDDQEDPELSKPRIPTENHKNATSTQLSPSSLSKTADAVVCDCYNKHFKNLLIDTVIPAPLEKVYYVLYGEGSQGMKEFLVQNRNKNVSVTPWTDNKRSLDYIMPINVPFGPQETECKVLEEIDHKDFNKYTSVVATISTPNVPNGTYFNPQTRTCFMHAGNGKTRMIVTGAITWHKTSWFKGPIERSTHDGSVIVAKDTENFINSKVLETAPEPKQTKKAKKHVRIRSNEKPVEKAPPAPIKPEAPPAPSLPSFNIKKLASPTMLLSFALVILLVSNMISWYHIHSLSHQIRHTETRLTKMVTDNIESKQPSDPASTLTPSPSPTSTPVFHEDFGEQLRHVQKLLSNIDQKIVLNQAN